MKKLFWVEFTKKEYKRLNKLAKRIIWNLSIDGVVRVEYDDSLEDYNTEEILAEFDGEYWDVLEKYHETFYVVLDKFGV